MRAESTKQVVCFAHPGVISLGVSGDYLIVHDDFRLLYLFCLLGEHHLYLLS